MDILLLNTIQISSEVPLIREKFMRIKSIVLIVTIVLAVVAFSSNKAWATAIDDWQKLIQEGSSKKFDGQYKAATQFFSQAVNLSESQKLPAKCLPIALCRLADAEVSSNQVNEADAHFKKLIDLMNQQKENGTLDPKVNFWAAVLSDSYMSNSRPETRETCLRRACYLKTFIYGGKHRECIDCVNKLADCYVGNGKIDRAISLLTAANKSNNEKGSDVLACTLHNMAVCSQRKHKYEQAKQLELAAIDIARSASASLKSELPNFYDFLSLNAFVEGKISESKQYFDMATSECQTVKRLYSKQMLLLPFVDLAIFDELAPSKQEYVLRQRLALVKLLREDPRWQCGILESLTNVLYAETKYKESEECLVNAIKIAQLPNCYAANDIPELYLKLGVHRCQTGKYSEGFKAFDQAFSAEKDKHAQHAALVLFWWGASLKERSQLVLAEQKLSQACDLAKALHPEKRGTLFADSLQMLAATKYDIGKQNEAHILNKMSADEIKIQKDMKTKLGPDFFHRL